MKLVFLGPPGAGKGTQASLVASRLGLPHLSTGDLLRSAVRERTALGEEARAYMDRGDLVPDTLVDRMVDARLQALADGYLLDGYPRNLAQAEALESAEGKRGRRLDAVVLIDLGDSEVKRRLTGRRSCPKDGTLYHVTERPPRVPGRCDMCNGELVVRSDDRDEVVADRLRVYHQDTEPLVAHYRKQGTLRTVDGTCSIDQVTAGVVAALGRKV